MRNNRRAASLTMTMMMMVMVIVSLLSGVEGFHLQMAAQKRVLIVGGTRFSGLYLWRELWKRGHSVTLYNRGKTAIQKLPLESEEEFQNRLKDTHFIKGNRQSAEDLQAKLQGQDFDVVYDLNGREAADTKPLADLFLKKVEHFIYMSSAGVYKKSLVMPHIEGDEEDVKSRHKGKLETESYLKSIGIPFTSIRPTYIYGPLNYNPLEEYFFERLEENRPICIPGNGKYLTGLGHVQDLAVAMAQVIGRDKAKGQIYNIQDKQSVTFESLAQLSAQAMNKDPKSVRFQFYDKKNFDFGDKKNFPMREQHFFCSVDKAIADLDWKPAYSMLEGLKDSYQNDFLVKKKSGGLKSDFSVDDLILNDQRAEVLAYKGY